LPDTLEDRLARPDEDTDVAPIADASSDRMIARIRNGVRNEDRSSFDRSLAIADRLVEQDGRFRTIPREDVARQVAQHVGAGMKPEEAAALALNYTANDGARVTPRALAKAADIADADAERAVRAGWDFLKVDPGDVHRPAAPD